MLVLGSDCEDEFDHGDINIGGGGELDDGVVKYDCSGGYQINLVYAPHCG